MPWFGVHTREKQPHKVGEQQLYVAYIVEIKHVEEASARQAIELAEALRDLITAVRTDEPRALRVAVIAALARADEVLEGVHFDDEGENQ